MRPRKKLERVSQHAVRSPQAESALERRPAMTVASQSRARRYEFLVRLRNRPFSFLLLDMIRRCGDVVHVPRLGYFVHDPAIAKAILEHPNVSNKEIGSYGAWFTQVLGEVALLNMEGPAHRQLKSF